MTQQRLADSLGVRSVTVSRWETGGSGSVQKRLRPALAAFLGITHSDLEELIGITGTNRENVVSLSAVPDWMSNEATDATVSADEDSERSTVIEGISGRLRSGQPLTDREVQLCSELLSTVT
jgi:transcriptional regulator with XRE-family HTH domain